MMKLLILPFTAMLLLILQPCQEEEAPNVLFIAVDDLRPELGCYGADYIHSPYIDKLATESTLFVNSYCNIPVCGASRASLLTGLRPTLTRFKRYYTRADEDAPEVTTLPGLFKENGYTTISNGKILHVKDDSADDWDEIWRVAGNTPRDYLLAENIARDTLPDSRGLPFEAVDVADSAYRDGQITLKSISDLRRLKEKDQPFFLVVGYHKPHLPFNAPQKYWDLYPEETINLPANRFTPKDVPPQALHNFGELRHYWGVPAQGPVSDSLAKVLIRGYYACVSYTDALVGQLLQTLKELDLFDNTIIVLWGDHGWNLYEHGLWCKHSNYRTSLKAPLLIHHVGQRKAFKRQEMVEFVDIYPTLRDLCGLPDPGHLQGNSLVALLGDNPAVSWKKYVQSVWHHGFTYTSKKFAYTEWRTDSDSIEAVMLFDHQHDPEENLNLIGSEGDVLLVESIRNEIK